MQSPAEDLVWLSRMLGDPVYDLAILAEGNASVRTGSTFLVKASGRQLASLDEDGLVEIDLELAAATLDGPDLSDDETREVLRQVSRSDRMPSVETFVHAYLQTLPGSAFVGHTHPTPLLSLLCTPHARKLAESRLFPDEIVCCGPESAFVPYVDPGLPLARAIRDSVQAFVARRGELPRTIWLQNHGLIALGSTSREVLGAHLMAHKAARVWLGALASGAEPNRLSDADIERIHTRPDEHYRQALLRQLANA